MRLRSITLFIAAAAAASPLWAHAHLVKSNPAMNAIAPSPRTLSLTFSERLVPAFSKLELLIPMKGRAMTVPLKTAVGADGRTLIGTPQRGLIKGAYVIRWTAASFDGHKMTGTVPFRIR
jgi:methionine-rich copper-binding protein CopC